MSEHLSSRISASGHLRPPLSLRKCGHHNSCLIGGETEAASSVCVLRAGDVLSGRRGWSFAPAVQPHLPPLTCNQQPLPSRTYQL